jgi:hypothetical protein
VCAQSGAGFPSMLCFEHTYIEAIFLLHCICRLVARRVDSLRRRISVVIGAKRT